MDDSYQRRINTAARNNFCSCGQSLVRKLIASPGGVHTCDDCVEFAHFVIFIERFEEKRQQPHFPIPFEIKSALDEYIIGQEKAKKRISGSVYNHYKPINLNGLKKAVGV